MFEMRERKSLPEHVRNNLESIGRRIGSVFSKRACELLFEREIREGLELILLTTPPGTQAAAVDDHSRFCWQSPGAVV